MGGKEEKEENMLDFKFLETTVDACNASPSVTLSHIPCPLFYVGVSQYMIP